MPFFPPKFEPRFYGEPPSSEAEALSALLPRVAPSDRKRLERDIAEFRRGERGEAQVRFELENSHLPICVIQDLCLEYQGLTAQIDFLVITPYHALVIECKNLWGNIEISRDGTFVRLLGHGRKEAMYSPVTQNERHLKLMRMMFSAMVRSADGLAGKMGFLPGFVFDKTFRSIIVLAEDRCVLKAVSAPQKIRDMVVRKDALVRYITSLDKGMWKRSEALSDEEMEEVAQTWVSLAVGREKDYSARYELLPDTPAHMTPVATVAETIPSCPKCGAPMVLRKATRGKYAGNRFWGCSRYPACGGIINLGKA